MDQQLIDAILQRQSALIGELVNKNIFLEAKLSIVEKQLAELQSKVEKDQAAKKVQKAA